MKKKLSKPNKLEIRQKQIEKALPEVKRLVKKHGLAIVSACLYRLKDYKAKLSKVKQAEEELVDLKRDCFYK